MTVKITDGWMEGTLPGPDGTEIWIRQHRQGPFEPLKTPAPNLVLHTTETDSYLPELEFPSQFQVGEGYIGQHKPLWAKGEALRGDTTNDPYGIQIEIVGHSKTLPWLPVIPSLDPLVALVAFLHKRRFIRTGLKRPTDAWPVRVDRLPAATEDYYRRKAGLWPEADGVFGHIEIPENTHWDPGGFDYPTFFGLVQGVLDGQEENMRLDEYQRGADEYIERRKANNADPGPPPDNMNDPDRRKGWVHQRAAMNNPKPA